MNFHSFLFSWSSISIALHLHLCWFRQQQRCLYGLISIYILFLIMPFDRLCYDKTSLMFSCRDLLMELLTLPPIQCGVMRVSGSDDINEPACSIHNSISTLCWIREGEWKIRTGNSVSRNSHRRWWHCVQNAFFRGGWLLIAKLKNTQPKTSSSRKWNSKNQQI